MEPESMDSTLPRFAKPPVVETVLGIQFDPIAGFSNAHLGLFWAALRRQHQSRRALGANWPRTQDAPSIAPVFEHFGSPARWEPIGLQLRVSNDPASRIQIYNGDETQMIQLQNSRLLLNWIRRGDSEYPRYSAIRPKFDELLEFFAAFLTDCSLEPPQLNQWEVTYVNHIPRGSVWQFPADWGSVFSKTMFPSHLGLPLESLVAAWHFVIPPERGRLHCELSHVRMGSTQNSEALRLTLTARGPASTVEDAINGLDTGRAAIVHSFTSLTSAEAHAAWEKSA